MTSKTYDYTVVPPPEDYAPAEAIEIILAAAVAVFLGSCICCVLYCKGFFKRQTGTNQRQVGYLFKINLNIKGPVVQN